MLKGTQHTKESIEKMRQTAIRIGRTPPDQTGYKFSEEQIQRIKENSSRYWLGKKRPDITGEKCHLWKGGITSIALQLRHGFNMRQWRSDIFTRDDYTCQLCGIRGGQLNADHYPKSFSEIMEDNNIKSVEDGINCAEMWNINNGRTLCVPCHKDTDNYLVNRKKNVS